MCDPTNAENQNVVKRAKEILTGFGVFLQSVGLDDSLFDCDKTILLATAKRYWDDVERLHEHHGMNLIDCHKIAGYTSYWICKMKPFRAKDMSVAYASGQAGLANKSFYINELFSLHMGLARINAHYKYIKSSKRVVLSAKHYEAMTYSLKHRQVSGDMLTLFFEMADGYSSGAVDSEVDLLYMYRQLSESDKARAVVIVKGLVDASQQSTQTI